MKNVTMLGLTGLLVGSVAILGANNIFAAETVATITAKDGDVKDVVSIDAQIDSVDGSHVTFTDTETQDTYNTSFGPSWFTEEYAAGEEVNVVGVVTEAENNNNGHNFQTLEVDGTTLRESFEGKPAWAGTRGGGNGTGNGQALGSMHRASGQGNGSMHSGQGFVDADGNGECDNMQ
jgi:hypothetical protein